MAGGYPVFGFMFQRLWGLLSGLLSWVLAFFAARVAWIKKHPGQTKLYLLLFSIWLFLNVDVLAWRVFAWVPQDAKAYLNTAIRGFFQLPVRVILGARGPWPSSAKQELAGTACLRAAAYVVPDAWTGGDIACAQAATSLPSSSWAFHSRMPCSPCGMHLGRAVAGPAGGEAGAGEAGSSPAAQGSR